MNDADLAMLARSADTMLLKDMRRRALELAVDSAGGGVQASETVAAAKEFYAFLKGE